MQQEFYILEKEYDGGYAKAIYSNSDSDIKVNICKVCEGRNVSLISNLAIEFKGRKKADYYWVPQHHIINDKLYKILKENGIKGFDIKDITIYEDFHLEGTPKSFKGDRLREMIINGRCGYVRKTNGDIMNKCEQCGKILEKRDNIVGINVNIKEWDGSDIFYFKNLFGLPIITEKVKLILLKNKIRNIKLTNIKDFKLF